MIASVTWGWSSMVAGVGVGGGGGGGEEDENPENQTIQ